MSGMAKPVAYIADHLRHVLVNGASAPHTAEVEWFFKNEIQSRGWYTGELRKLARRFSRVILHDASLDYLVQVADQLFQGNVLEEKVLAVLLLQPSAAKCTPQHFELFCTWLQRVSTWADHDGLVQYLIGPMIVLDPQRRRRIYQWAASPNRWHRRAAAVALLRGTNLGLFYPDVRRITKLLLHDEDLMVQKGLGWLLRETVRFDNQSTMPLLTSIQKTAPRLVLRTACERLAPELRDKVMQREKKPASAKKSLDKPVPARKSSSARVTRTKRTGKKKVK